MEKEEEIVSDAAETNLQKMLFFSEIGSLQVQHTITYCLQEVKNFWILTVSQQKSNQCRTESVKLSLDREHALQLRDYLYENAVLIESWQDIIADVLPAAAQVPM